MDTNVAGVKNLSDLPPPAMAVLDRLSISIPLGSRLSPSTEDPTYCVQMLEARNA